MKNYFDDIKFRIVTRHFLIFSGGRFARAESNSLEFIRSGRLILECADGSRRDLTSPAFFWIRRGTMFRYVTDPDSGNRNPPEHIYLDFNGKRSDLMMEYLDELFPRGVFTPENPEKVSEIFFDLLRLYRGGAEIYHPEMAALTENLMAAAYMSAGEKKKIRDDYGIDHIAEMLRSDPFKDYDFAAMAQHAGLSIDHFRRLFRARHKFTPRNYLHQQQMIRAAELLRNTEMRIKEIVFSCRFVSDIDFSRKFKKYSGLSPRAYREQFRDTDQTNP